MLLEPRGKSGVVSSQKICSDQQITIVRLRPPWCHSGGLCGGLDVHNPVVLLWASLPGVGAIAYMFSRPLFKFVLVRLLLDHAVYKMPLQVHRRIGAGRWLSPKTRHPTLD